MSKNLVIVESPAKAKTIEKYLGQDFQVLSSIGHIRSIAKKTKDGKPSIEVDNDFFAHYEVDPEKKKVIAEIERASKMLSNPGFVNKAPEAKINEEKAKLEKYQNMLKNLEERLK